MAHVPLRHPVPTHPVSLPDPPSTPSSPDGYQRFSSSPGPAPPQQHPQPQMYSSQHVPAYPMTSPFQHNQHNAHPPPQPHHQQQSFVPQPSFGAWGVNDATAQFGMQLGTSAVAAGQEYVQKNFGGFIPLTSVKAHFNVSNSYVINKIKLVLFPWMHKSWKRRVLRTEQGHVEYQSPRDDINSPDLYIPLMAFVTYVLISGFHSGIHARFHPRILGESASSALGVIIVDFLSIYVGCYFCSVQTSGQVLDILAYSGYKFVGVIFTILSSYLYFSGALYYVIFFYFFFANALFLLRSLRSLVLPDPALSSSPTANASAYYRSRRITFLFIEAMCQIVYMFFLVRV
ncbi:YIF1-domain-containing protein [Dendrothele bispora CBS 962.96]|uniref:Protein YIF1 n=1 Tax=Dendrothele bispora (strain CBS 962.96) TaxID=1314807 RepID=A0A4S8MRW5_DENBC|nr:YIF1-domain-containing protein [Dendrothele bispora CBS 962.96]